MNWENERTLRFIKEYEKRPILWQKSDKHYHNVIKKEDAWRELNAIFDEDISVLKKKIESLRGSRRREKARMLRSMRTGKGRANIYISKWFAWDSLMFLDDPETIRPTVSNYDTEVTTEEMTELSPEDPEETERCIDDHDVNEQVNGNNNNVSHPSTRREKTFVSPKKSAPKRKRSEDPRINEAFNILKHTMQSNKAKDDSTIFGEYIAEKLRKHDPRTRMILQHQIHSLLFQAEMNSQQFSVPQQTQSTPGPMQTPIRTQMSASFTAQTPQLIELPGNYHESSASHQTIVHLAGAPFTAFVVDRCLVRRLGRHRSRRQFLQTRQNEAYVRPRLASFAFVLR